MAYRSIPLVPASDVSLAGGVSLHFRKYISLHLEFYRCLLIQITLKCPLECEHCCVDAGPNRKESLDEERLIAGIRSFSEIPSAQLVCFTGGEPFSARNLLRKSLALCSELGLKGYVITAAHWATSVQSARNVLGSLPTIALLSISADRQHEKFVPLENVRNAVQAAVELGMGVNLLLTTEKDGGVFEARLSAVLLDFWETLDIHRTPLGAVGRSTDEFSPEVVDFASDDGPCPLIGTPAVTAGGAVSACCQVNETNLVSLTDHALKLGEIGIDSFPSMQRKITSDPIFRAIRLAGPKWIIRRAQTQGILNSVELDKMSLCKACSYVVRNSETTRILRAELEKQASALQLNYLELMRGDD